MNTRRIIDLITCFALQLKKIYRIKSCFDCEIICGRDCPDGEPVYVISTTDVSDIDLTILPAEIGRHGTILSRKLLKNMK
jgi:hypothetical protein